ncbi:hypothetical protein JCGZ_10105 [Jatropha curcas]|uniref:Uncharacterized protein n=1 Tax=Jatropha curcas TaxID=180498 RepID=A0A067LN74_JATCU|nr:uncharacterized protein LOC105632422 [Jatropha curcas]KDP46265.1 hypothetical protein JCGZ_10105 [Jatropha curcas]
MESNRKRRGFMKGKLIPFYRSSKATSTVQYSSKVKPSQSSPSAASVGFVVHQDYIITPPKQKVSFIVPTADSNRDKYLSQFDKLYGVAGDEGVDIKAATYISSVQERFKLERSNSERIKYDDKK